MGSGNSKGASGFRVFRVVPGGPAHEAGLEIFFDYVVEVNGIVVDSETQSFAAMIKDEEGKRVKLTVYNCRTQALRDVFVIPRSWDGQGLLGLVVKFDLIENGENQGLRILEVHPNSPASKAGLIAFKDFIICSGDIIIRDGGDLAELVNSHIGDELSLTVYNTDTESIRDVKVTPLKDWGGEGLLGFSTGSGVLHRIPMARKPLKVADESPKPVAPAEPSPSPEVTDPSSPVEPSPTPPVPNLIPLPSVSNVDERSPNKILLTIPEIARPTSPAAVQAPVAPVIVPAAAPSPAAPSIPKTVEQHYIATPMSDAAQAAMAAPLSETSEYSQSITETFGLVPPANVTEEAITEPSAQTSGYSQSMTEVFGLVPPANATQAGISEPPSERSDYSQSVAEAFGLVPPANTAEESSARRSSDGSSAVMVEPIPSPDIAKLFD
jgi:hypothetical protein